MPNAVQVSATATNAMKGLMASDPQRAWGYFNALHAGGLADAFHFTIAIPLCNTREGLQRLVHEMHDMMKGCRAGQRGARACLRSAFERDPRESARESVAQRVEPAFGVNPSRDGGNPHGSLFPPRVLDGFSH